MFWANIVEFLPKTVVSRAITVVSGKNTVVFVQVQWHWGINAIVFLANTVI